MRKSIKYKRLIDMPENLDLEFEDEYWSEEQIRFVPVEVVHIYEKLAEFLAKMFSEEYKTGSDTYKILDFAFKYKHRLKDLGIKFHDDGTFHIYLTVEKNDEVFDITMRMNPFSNKVTISLVKFRH